MPDKKFLETYPLYKPFDYEAPPSMENINHPSIKSFCRTCEADQTFQHSIAIDSVRRALMSLTAEHDPAGLCIFVGYKCAGCSKENMIFLMKIADDRKSVMKVGQDPAWDISGDKNLEKLLGTHRSYLRRGLICESQGYGIAAFAYYRRITEEVIDELLNDLGDLIPEEDKKTYAAAFEKAKKTRQTSEKIQLVKDLLPAEIIADGMNPLGILHSALSEGLHAETDEECLDEAEIIREALIYLSGQISEAKSKRMKFTSNIRRLMDKKAKS